MGLWGWWWWHRSPTPWAVWGPVCKVAASGEFFLPTSLLSKPWIPCLFLKMQVIIELTSEGSGEDRFEHSMVSACTALCSGYALRKCLLNE